MFLRPFALCSSLLSLILTGVCGACILLGARLRPPSDVMAGFIDCGGLICWHGILPDVTGASAAGDVLRAFDPRTVHRGDNFVGTFSTSGTCAIEVYYENGVVRNVNFAGCHALALGDVFAQLGMPDVVSSAGALYYENQPIRIDLSQFAAFGFPDCADYSTPRAAFYQIELLPAPPIPPPPFSVEWRGFLPYARYVNDYGLESCE